MPLLTNILEDFVSNDLRSKRSSGTTTIESVISRSEMLLPPSLIKDKTILDLGCCIASTGAWALAHGASKYVGIDLQNEHIEKAQWLLSKYFDDSRFEVLTADIETFLSRQLGTFDIVVLSNVLCFFVDQQSILKRVCSIANDFVCIEHIYPMVGDSQDLLIQLNYELMNSATELGSHLSLGGKMSPNALRMIMKTFGFYDNDGIIYPREIVAPDMLVNARQRGRAFTPSRYNIRFSKIECQEQEQNSNCIPWSNNFTDIESTEKFGRIEQSHPLKPKIDELRDKLLQNINSNIYIFDKKPMFIFSDNELAYFLGIELLAFGFNAFFSNHPEVYYFKSRVIPEDLSPSIVVVIDQCKAVKSYNVPVILI